ncbi:DsbA family protein [Frigidibacter sp. RF13]|uniref:DsbA family protein n=1 Tax=Frigidibacter sp. RF13 TaxID=2997340 RepID=UPI00227109DA|nr:DsbA family protein [Frigidibacter sp. RF13]MCY1125688.1 DsbA family protein [Frigidibacter sp. RF13]
MRSLIPISLAAGLLASSALAFDPASMNDAEKEAFGAAVRAYLLEHPEVLSEVVEALEAKRAAAQVEGDKAIVAANAAEIFADPASFVGGNPEGGLTVVEFLDYRCGYCRKAHAEVAELVRSDGDIRYVVKEFPILGEESLLASRFAIAALQVVGPEAYEKVNAGFYESFRGDVTEETLAAFAVSLGLDPAPILAGMNAPEVTAIIEANHLLAQRMDISGTPTFIIGDQVLRGFAPLDAMRQIVEDARS